MEKIKVDMTHPVWTIIALVLAIFTAFLAVHSVWRSCTSAAADDGMLPQTMTLACEQAGCIADHQAELRDRYPHAFQIHDYGRSGILVWPDSSYVYLFKHEPSGKGYILLESGIFRDGKYHKKKS